VTRLPAGAPGPTFATCAGRLAANRKLTEPTERTTTMRKTLLIASALAAGLVAATLGSGVANAKVGASQRCKSPTVVLKAQPKLNSATVAQSRCQWGCQQWDRYGQCVRYGQVCR
jgi:hypothetical protein